MQTTDVVGGREIVLFHPKMFIIDAQVVTESLCGPLWGRI